MAQEKQLIKDPRSLGFPEKLWKITSDPQYDEAIHWNPNGTSIVIPNLHKFHIMILNHRKPMFKTKNTSSFVRQLNYYGFRTVAEKNRSKKCRGKTWNSRCEFKHPLFRRDNFGKCISEF